MKLIKTPYLFILFTAFYFIFSLATYKDYGITFDEQVEYDSGAYLAKYYTTATTPEYATEMLTKGPVNMELRQLPIFAVYSRIYTMVLALLNFRYYFEWFHLLNLFFGFFLFLFSYLFFLIMDHNAKKAVVSPVLLFLTPYVLGHIPANPKDIPFAWAYLAGLFFTLLFAVKKVDYRVRIIILGLSFGLAIALRTIGLTLLVISFTNALIYQVATQKSATKSKITSLLNIILEHLLITFIALFTWIVCMPWLGANFPINFIQAIFNAASYSPWKGTIFYLGEFLTKEQRPWHYLFVLLGVKLPIPLLVFFIIGIYIFIRKVIRKAYPSTGEFILFFTIALNFFIYLVMHPVVYNGIRHFLFLIVVIVLFATHYLIEFIENLGKEKFIGKVIHKKGLLAANLKKLVVTGIAIYFVFTAIRMIILHPYEYVYFNELTGGLKGAQYLFQLDYWGASYKEASAYALELSQKNGLEDLKVFSCDSRFAVDYYSKFKYQLVGGLKDSEIIFCDNFRDDMRNLNQPIIHEIKREGVTLLYVRAQPQFYQRYKDFLYK